MHFPVLGAHVSGSESQPPDLRLEGIMQQKASLSFKMGEKTLDIGRKTLNSFNRNVCSIVSNLYGTFS